MITIEDKVLIRNLWESKGYSAQQLIHEFPDKNWKWRGIEKLLRKLQETGLLDCLMGIGRRRTLQSYVVQPGAVAEWWCSWPMANVFVGLCLSKRWTFWTCLLLWTNMIKMSLILGLHEYFTIKRTHSESGMRQRMGKRVWLSICFICT